MKGFFGRKKPEAEENPYAQQQAQEEYDRMTPYQRARADVAGSGPGSRPPFQGGLPSGPGPRRNQSGSPAQSAQSYGGSTYGGSTYGGPARSESQTPQGYGSNRYGNDSGYGSDRFGGANTNAYSSNSQHPPPARTSGYGGLGRRPEEHDANKDELFGGVPQSDGGPNRYAARPPVPGENTNRYAPGANAQAPPDDNDYADEDLTPEQMEERQYRKIRTETKQVRQDNLSSTQRTLAMLNQAEETGMRTLANLGAQGERLNRVEQNLNVSSAHARTAEAKTKELKTLNRSMFAVHIENPLTKKKRLAAHEQAILDQSRADRSAQENARAGNYQDQQGMENFFNRVDQHRSTAPVKNDKYEFSDSDEPESEDEKQWKSEETHNLKLISHGLNRVKDIATEQGRVIQAQNGTIDRIADKTDGVTDHVVKNSAKLRTFK